MASRLTCQEFYYLFYVLHLDFHLLKDVFFTPNNIFSLLLAILASLLALSSLRLQEYWTRLQTLFLKMLKEKEKNTQLLESSQNFFFFI